MSVAFVSAVVFGFFYWQINQVRDLVLKELEQTIGFSLAYDSIDPHFLSKFKIRNARIFDPEALGEDLLSFSSLELTLDIWTLLGFSSEFLIQRVMASDLVIQVDLENESQREKFQKLSKLLSSGEEKDTENPFFSSLKNRRNFSLYVNNIQIKLTLPQVGQVNLTTDNISLLLVNGRWDLTGILSLSLQNSNLAGLSGLSSQFNVKGFGKLDPWQAQFLLSVQGLRGDGFQIVDHGYFFSWSSEYLRILNTTGDSFNLDILYEFEPKELKGAFTAKDWQLLNILSVVDPGEVSVLGDLFTYSLEAEGAVLYSNSQLSYSLKAKTHLDERFPEILQGSLSLDVRGNEHWLTVSDLNFKNRSEGELSFKGDFSFVDLFPRGDLRFSRFVWQGSQPISGQLNFSEVEKEGYFVSSKNLRVGDFGIKTLDISLQNRENELFFDGLLTFPKDLSSRVSFSGKYPFADQMDLSLEVNQFPLEDFYLILPQAFSREAEILEQMTEGYIANASVAGIFNFTSPDDSRINRFHISAQSRTDPSQGLFLKADGYKELITISQFDFKNKSWFVSTTGQLGLFPGLLLEADLNVDINGQKTLPLNLAWHTGEKTVSLLGEENLSFVLSYAEDLEGLLSMRDFVVPLGETTITLNQKLILMGGAEGQDWIVDWEEFNLVAKNSPLIPDWSLSWQALVTKDILTIENIVVEDPFSLFMGGGVVQDWLTTGRGSLFLTSESTEESLQVLWQQRDNNFSLELGGEGLWTEHFQNPSLPVQAGLVDVGLSLLWEEEEGLITSGNLKLREAYFMDSPLKVESAFAFLADTLISSNTQFQLGEKLIFLDDIKVDLREQKYNFKGYLESINLRNQKRAVLSRWQGNGQWQAGINDGETDFKLSFLGDKIQQKNLKGKVLDFTLTKEGDLFSVASHDEVSLKGSYHRKTGRVSMEASDPYPVRGRLEGFVLSNLLDLRLENLRVEIEELPFSIMVQGAFALQGATIMGNLFLGGTPSAPEFNGKLTASGVRLTTPYVGTLNFDGSPDEMTIGPFEATGFLAGNLIYLVNSSAQWTGLSSIEDLPAIETQIDRDKVGIKGLFIMDGWELDRLQLWVDTLTSKRGIPIAFNQAGIRAKGYALGSLLLEVQGEHVNVKGDLTLNQVDMSLKEEKAKPLDPRRQKVEPVVTADFDLTLGRSVRFLWPNEILPLFKGIADNNQKVKLTFDGFNNDFSLLGDVGIRSGTLTYYSSSFFLTKGKIIFNENQDSFNPYIEVQAEMRLTDTAGENTNNSVFGNRSTGSIKVLLNVNSLLSEMIENATLSSVPSRSQDELRLILGIGDVSVETLNRQGGAESLGEVGLNIASGLVTNVIFKPIEDFFRNTLNLDYFSLSSDWLKKLSTMWVPGASNNVATTSGTGNPDPSATGTTNNIAPRETTLETLARVLDNTRISAGKYVAEGVFLEGGFTLSQGKETYLGRPIAANVDVGFEINAAPIIVGWQAGLDLANLSSFDSFSNQISVGWSFTY